MVGMNPGPFLNDMGDWWVPVDVVPNYVKARALVLQHIEHPTKVQFVGKEMARLTDHEFSCDGVHRDGTCFRDVESWHFQDVEW